MANLIGKIKKILVKLLLKLGFRKAFVKLNRLLIRKVTPRMARLMQVFFKYKKGKIVSCSTGGVSNMQYFLLLRELLCYEGWDSIKRYNDYNGYSLLTKIFYLPYHLATAEVIIVEDIYRPIKHLKRNDQQIIIQTWHALGAFKKFGRALAATLERLENEDQNEISYSHRYNYILDPGLKFREKYYESFAPGCKVLESVFNPRVDLLFNEKYIEMRSNQVINNFPELKDRKVCIYAPTYRGFSARRDSSHFMDFDLFLDNIPDDTIVALKRHPSMKKSRYYLPSQRNIHKFIDVTNANINDLLQIADYLVTDYSSVFFEMALINKPIYFLVKDMDQYLDDRGFYFDLKNFVPGPLCKDELELAEEISKQGDTDRITAFVREYFGEVPNDSAKRLADFIANYSKKKGTELRQSNQEKIPIKEILSLSEAEIGSYVCNLADKRVNVKSIR